MLQTYTHLGELSKWAAKATIVWAFLSLTLVACHKRSGLNGVYLQKDSNHIFTALKFYSEGTVDIADSHLGTVKGTYTAEGDRVTINLGQHPMVFRVKDGCLNGGSMIGVFCATSRNSN